MGHHSCCNCWMVGADLYGGQFLLQLWGMVGAGLEPAPTISIVPFISHRYTLRAFSSRAHQIDDSLVDRLALARCQPQWAW